MRRGRHQAWKANLRERPWLRVVFGPRFRNGCWHMTVRVGTFIQLHMHHVSRATMYRLIVEEHRRQIVNRVRSTLLDDCPF